jgi:HD-like signal output (HDOD) protein
MEELEKHNGRGESLPLDAVAATQLLDLFRDPDHDLDRIVEFISHDPALAAATLRRCNNVMYGRSERVTDLFEAVNLLGYYELYGIIAGSIGTRTGRPAERAAHGQGRGPVRMDLDPSLD